MMPRVTTRLRSKPLKWATLTLVFLGSLCVNFVESSASGNNRVDDIADWGVEIIDETNGRNLQVYDATAGNSYAIFGVRNDATVYPDVKNMGKKCFSGLGLRGCKIRQSFLDEAGDGWLQEESEELNSLLTWDDDGFVSENEEYW